jgi:Na+-transporting methylmalonyl-CoA/oxaloacetate decarboxylase beta subunit
LKLTDFATLAEPIDVLLDARRQFGIYSHILLQALADFLPDCSAVRVVNIDGVAHDGTSLFRGTPTLPIADQDKLKSGPSFPRLGRLG